MLRLESINKSFKSGNNNEMSVLKDVSLAFPNTGLFVILGPSGSGKTTLLSLIGGLDDPDTGSIFFNDVEINKLDEKKRDEYRQNLVSFVFQDHNLIDYLNLKDNAVLKSNSSNEEVTALLEKLNIASLENKKPETLSGGEKQRCAIARALLSNSQVLLCDEPTASLDHKNAETILEILKEVGKTKLVIAVSHDEKLCRKYTENIITFDDGKVIQEKAVENEEPAIEYQPVKQKIYRSKLLHKALYHSKHKIKESSLVIFLSMVAFFCVSMIVGLSTGTRIMVDDAINELIHYSPLTVSSYYNDITSIALIKSQERTYNIGVNIDQKTSIVSSLHKNIITDEFVNYLTAEPKKDTYFSFNNDQAYSVIYQDDNGSYNLFDSQNVDSLNDYVESFFGKRSPINELIYEKDYFMEKYQWLEGRFPENDNEAVLVYLDHYSVTEDAAKIMGLKETDDPAKAIGRKIYLADHNKLYNVNDTVNVTGHFLKDAETLKREGHDLRSLSNDFVSYVNNYYEGDVEGQKAVQASIYSLFKEEAETKTLNAYSKTQRSSALKDLIDDKGADEITITGIARVPEGTYFAEKNTGILISKNKLSDIREQNSKSAIAKEIDNHIVLSDFKAEYLSVPKLYGYVNTPTEYSGDNLENYLLNFIDFFENRKFFSVNNEISSIEIYAPDVETKDYYVTKIDKYNKGKDSSLEMKYLDLSSRVVEYFDHYLLVIEKVLFAISVITLIVSGMLSIAVFFNMSMSRIKEIGILRACGYPKSYIFGLLEVESVGFGLVSGCLGVLLANIAAPIMCNYFSVHSSDFLIDRIVIIKPIWSIIIIVLSLLTSFIAGLIPSIMSAKKKPIDIIKM